MQPDQSSAHKTSALRLARAFFHESADMLRHPLKSWLSTTERSRERYVGRSSTGVESEVDRQAEQTKREGSGT